MFNLPQLIALAADFPAASAINLSPMSICLILAASTVLEDSKNWQGADYDLTAEEIEIIHDIVATMQSEVQA